MFVCVSACMRACLPVGECICTHSMCQTCTGALSKPDALFTTLFPLSLCLSFVIFLSADNMVDKTKVETSEAKAIELEKKVNYTQQWHVIHTYLNVSIEGHKLL